MNLVTSCMECNLGKRDRELSDESAIMVQRTRVEELQEKQDQILMAIQWGRDLDSLEEFALDHLEEYWSELTSYTLTESGRESLRRLLGRFEFKALVAAMNTAAKQYLTMTEGAKATHESVEIAWNKIAGILTIQRQEEKRPGIKRLYYIRGIGRKRFRYFDDHKAIALLKQCHRDGVSVEVMESLTKEVANWSTWVHYMKQYSAFSRRHQEAENSAKGKFNLGKLYLYGDDEAGIVRDPDKAVHWLTKSAEEGNEDARIDLAVLYFNGSVVERDLDEVERLCDGLGHHPVVSHLLGRIAMQEDTETGLEWLNQSADQGFLPSLRTLAQLYDDGDDVEEDWELSLEYRKRAAELGCSESLFIVGQSADRQEEAVHYFRQAAEKGHAEASLELGLHLIGMNVKKEGAKWLRKASELGVSRADLLLGKSYLNGDFTIKSERQARIRLRKAAREGWEEATGILLKMKTEVSARK